MSIKLPNFIKFCLLFTPTLMVVDSIQYLLLIVIISTLYTFGILDHLLSFFLLLPTVLIIFYYIITIHHRVTKFIFNNNPYPKLTKYFIITISVYSVIIRIISSETIAVIAITLLFSIYNYFLLKN